MLPGFRPATSPLCTPQCWQILEAMVILDGMSDVTGILSAIEDGDLHAAEQLLPLVYQELRQLAAEKMANERPGQTLQATALVHEAYLRLVDEDRVQHWDSWAHFFAAAAQAMRRLLIDQARRKQRPKHGGGRRRLTRCPSHPAARDCSRSPS